MEFREQSGMIGIFNEGSDIECATNFVNLTAEIASAMLYIEIIQAPLEDFVDLVTFGLFGLAHMF